ncbi:hypothetical protein HAX54_004976, partial [Datura stramonium]|nr:hypothetical protein [Datura stramonium]
NGDNDHRLFSSQVRRNADEMLVRIKLASSHFLDPVSDRHFVDRDRQFTDGKLIILGFYQAPTVHRRSTDNFLRLARVLPVLLASSR